MDIALMWLVEHYPIFGWIIFLFIVGNVGWKASTVFSRLEDAIARTERVEVVVNTVATNHLPHLQEAIESLRDVLAEELKGLRSDLLQFLLREK